MVGPCAYCTLEHGGNLFPDLVTRLDQDGYTLLSITRKTLCTSVRLAGLECDPAICLRAMERRLPLDSDHPEASWGWFVKQLYTGYQDRAHAAAERSDPDGLLAEALADLGLV